MLNYLYAINCKLTKGYSLCLVNIISAGKRVIEINNWSLFIFSVFKLVSELQPKL